MNFLLCFFWNIVVFWSSEPPYIPTNYNAEAEICPVGSDRNSVNASETRVLCVHMWGFGDGNKSDLNFVCASAAVTSEQQLNFFPVVSRLLLEVVGTNFQGKENCLQWTVLLENCWYETIHLRWKEVRGGVQGKIVEQFVPVGMKSSLEDLLYSTEEGENLTFMCFLECFRLFYTLWAV